MARLDKAGRVQQGAGLALAASALAWAAVGCGSNAATKATETCVGSACAAETSHLVALADLNCAATTVSSPFPAPRSQYREVLGSVLLPLRYQPEVDVTRSPNKRWPYSIKMPIFVRQRTRPVLVSVPKPLRSKAALAWADTPPASSIRLRSCSTTGVGADGWTGGLFLRSRAPLCLSLVVSIRERRESVPFGIGRQC